MAEKRFVRPDLMLAAILLCGLSASAGDISGLGKGKQTESTWS